METDHYLERMKFLLDSFISHIFKVSFKVLDGVIRQLMIVCSITQITA
jgi:hypothetical protein